MGQNLGQFIIFLPQIIVLSVAGIKVVNNFVVIFVGYVGIAGCFISSET